MTLLFRLLLSCALIFGLVYGLLLAVAEFVPPVQKQMTYKIPREKLPH